MTTAELVEDNEAGREVTTQLESMPVPVVSESVGKSHAWLTDRCAEIASSLDGAEPIDVAEGCEGSCVHVTKFCAVCQKQTPHLVINEDRYGIEAECVECNEVF